MPGRKAGMTRGRRGRGRSLRGAPRRSNPHPVVRAQCDGGLPRRCACRNDRTWRSSELEVQKRRHVRREEERLHGEREAAGERPAARAFRQLVHRRQGEHDRPAEQQAGRDLGKTQGARITEEPQQRNRRRNRRQRRKCVHDHLRQSATRCSPPCRAALRAWRPVRLRGTAPRR